MPGPRSRGRATFPPARFARWSSPRTCAGSCPTWFPGRGEDAFQALLWLERDVQAYEPLATFEGERPEWDTLSRLTRQLSEEVSSGDATAARHTATAAHESVERLIDLNRLEADTIG